MNDGPVVIAGGLGTITLNGTTFAAPATLDSVVIYAFGTSAIDAPQFDNSSQPPLTLGSQATVVVSGAGNDLAIRGDAINEGSAFVSGASAVIALTGGTIQNQGIAGASGGATIDLGNPNFATSGPFVFQNSALVENQGTATASGVGGLLSIDAATVTNNGLLSVAGGAELLLGLGVKSFSQTGTVAVDAASTVLVQGTVTTATLNTIAGSGASLVIDNLLDNTGSVITIGTADPFASLVIEQPLELADGIGGTVRGGTIVIDHSGSFAVSGTLNGVVVDGSIVLVNDTVTIDNGLSVTTNGGPGQVSLTNSSLSLNQPQTLTALDITAGPGTSGIYFTTAETIDAASNVALTSPGSGFFVLGGVLGFEPGYPVWHPMGSLTNAGTIQASGSGNELRVNTSAFANAGQMTVSSGATLVIDGADSGHLGQLTVADAGSTLALFGSLATSQLGSIISTGAHLVLGGTLDNTGNTLAVGTGDAFATAQFGDTGTYTSQVNFLHITGGAIRVDDGGSLSFQLVVLNDVQLPDSININNGNAGIAGGLHFAAGGRPSINLQNSTFYSLDNGTLDNVDLTVGPGMSDLDGWATIGAGASLSLVAAGSNTLLIGGAVPLDNFGSFSIGGAGNEVEVAGATLGNSGAFTIASGATLQVAAANLTGTGTIQLATGTVDFTGMIANAGTLAFTAASGVLQFDQPGSVAATVEGWIEGDAVALTQPGSYALGFASGTLDVLQAGTQVAAFNVGTGYSLSSFSLDTSGGDALIGIACFARGTRIATPHGERAVEHLAPGDLVLLASGATAPIVRIVRRRIDPAPPALHPVRIRRGAFGHGRPHRDLLLSPDHALYLDSALVPIRHLIDGAAIAPIPCRAIDYFHVELPRHDVILAEGLPVESYLALAADAARAWEAHGYAPLIVSGPAIHEARTRINLSASA